MHIDIHLFGVALQEEERERIRRGRHQVVVSRGERVQHQAVANQPPVDEDVDRIAIGLLHLRAREEAVEPEAAHGRVFGLRAAILRDRLLGRREGGTLTGGSNRSRSRTPISTSSSRTWLPNTW